MTQLRFDGKVALITGGGGAIGKAHAMALGRPGARVALVDYPIGPLGERDSDPGRRETQAVRVLADLGIEAIGLTADVTNDTQLRSAVASIIERWGGIDILVCNAGDDVIEEAPAQGLERQFDVHVRGSLIATRAVWPSMTDRGGGHIMLTGSAA